MPNSKVDFVTVGMSRREAARILAASVTAPLLNGQDRQPDHEPDVPYVPTTDEAVEAMLKLAGVTKDDIVYDLGCGDGRIVITAAKVYGAKAVGIDIDPVRIDEAKANAKKAGAENLVRFEEKDLFKADFHEATVVALFLFKSVNLRLRPKLLAELKPGTRIVSNTFDMGDWKPEQQLDLNAPDEEFLSRHLFLWTVPEPTKK